MQLVKQSPKTEAIIFDMDGVLVSSRKAAASALFTVAMSEGVKVDEAMVINALDRGNSALSIVSCPCPT
jgi:beta-phosphoglucomutase-like phosphatase (HAD superfamily)